MMSESKALNHDVACAGVVLWHNALPGYEDKSGMHISRYPNIRQDCGNVNHGTIR